MENSHSASYAAAGVDIEAGYKGVQLMKKHVTRTMIPGVVSGIGGFGGLFAPDLAGMKEPVLVSGTDGVGTKIRLAQLLDKHDTIGIDCVAMCVNDIICVQSGCALIGGETAEHPGIMAPDDYDLAGFSVGVVDQEKIIDSAKIQKGDSLIGLSSTGVHSNGFSLVRKVFDIEHADLTSPMDELEGKSLGEALLAPTRIYVKSVLALIDGGVDLHGASHITGGGFYENIPRMLPEGLSAALWENKLPRLPIFELIQKRGDIPVRDMYNTFNMGVGMVLAVPAEQEQKALDILRAAGEDANIIGIVARGSYGVAINPPPAEIIE